MMKFIQYAGRAIRKLANSPFVTLALILTAATPWVTRAACTVSPGGRPAVYNINGFSPGPVDPDVANGSVLYSTTVSTGSIGSYTFTCPGGSGVVYYRGVTTLGSYNAYSTSVPGVGIRFQFKNTYPEGWWPGIYDYGSRETTTLASSIPMIIELVKTGDISSGTISGEVAGWFAQNNTSQIVSIVFQSAVTITPKKPTCAVTTTSIDVNLGKMLSLSTFSGVGSTSPETSFDITLNCKGGGTGATSSIYITLTDKGNTANTTSTMQLASGSIATGIGIQILRNSTLIKFGPESAVIGNNNQWLAGYSGNGTFTIPLTARYVQTASKVTAGTANGIAAFTIGYK